VDGHAHHLFSWDVPLLVLLAATFAVYASLARRSERGTYGEAVFAGGLALVFFALWMPVTSLALRGSHLAYMLQMEVLVGVAPVLLLLGLRPLLGAKRSFLALPAVVPLGVWLLAIYAWHLPYLHALAMQFGAVYMVQLLSFLGAGLLFWWFVISPGTSEMRPLGKLAYLAAAQAGAGLLAAVLIWSPEALYHHQHAAASLPWGISALLDQRLSGAVMMVADMLVASTVAGWVILGALNGSEGRDRSKSSPAVE
jgi:cytochrome c oxidase assembly factor CtaG